MKLPLGYKYSAVYAGIRKVEKDDLALILSSSPAPVAAVFTENRVQAAPVKLSKHNLDLSGGVAQAFLVNAGNANCATKTGDDVALASVKALGKLLKIPSTQVIPASTGVIGVELDGKLITEALPRLLEGASEKRFEDVARAITTTDTFPKTSSREVVLPRGTVRVAGMTKGAGMIHPRMATTLGFVLTDAAFPPSALQRILRRSVERSYNRISVDGDTSTNDMVALMANGASGVRPTPTELDAVTEAIGSVMEDLAKQIVRDGEGAKKFVTIRVEGAATEAAAVKIARSIANSPLVKTAIAGADPNWGRILSAAGNAGVEFDPATVDIFMQDVEVCRGGIAAPFSEAELIEKLNQPEISILFTFRGKNRGRSQFWTCDFTEGYIQINASYRT